jgi:hypothetical protein
VDVDGLALEEERHLALILVAILGDQIVKDLVRQIQ